MPRIQYSFDDEAWLSQEFDHGLRVAYEQLNVLKLERSGNPSLLMEVDALEQILDDMASLIRGVSACAVVHYTNSN